MVKMRLLGLFMSEGFYTTPDKARLTFEKYILKSKKSDSISLLRGVKNLIKEAGKIAKVLFDSCKSFVLNTTNWKKCPLKSCKYQCLLNVSSTLVHKMSPDDFSKQ